MNWFRKSPAKPLRQEPISTPVKERDGLRFLFAGTDGKNYYTFPHDSALPTDRLKEQIPLLEFMRIGMAGEDQMALMDAIDKANLDIAAEKEAKKRTRLHGLISTYTTIARGRLENGFHHRLILQMAALWVIREDEEAEKYSSSIQNQKVLFFEAECKEGSAHDFFTLTGFSGLNRFTEMSKAQFDELWNNSIRNQETLLETIDMLTRGLMPLPR